MYIKSMVIDGFKSYAQRTEINGFDPMFNAITGLNGSGKSNILDAICFLLGITNLTQVRATNLQELVYKNGQAGVTKATVSITFDNRDKEQSPMGYDQYDELTITRQVIIGGRNKYLINGSNANNTRVQDLFRSVQLNVNNPHFLIMQGRITKVLNMKPPEIMSMIEEAAGTTLYESKKKLAQKTIEKKDAKLREIDNILKEEINPTLNRLKEERASYMEFQKVNRELEHLNKLYIAYQFVHAEEVKQKSANDLIEMEKMKEALAEKQVACRERIEKLHEVIDQLEKKRDQESGGALADLEAELSVKKKEEAKAQSNITHKKESLKAEQKKLKDLEKQRDADSAALKKKQKDMEKISGSFADLEKKCIKDQEAHTEAQKHFHAVSAGLSKNADGEDASLNDQLMGAKKEASASETESKQAHMRLKHAKETVKKKQAELNKTEQGYKKEQATYEALKQNMRKLQAELDKLQYEEGKEEKLVAERRSLTQEVHHLTEKVETLQAKFPQLQFEYRDPERNFNRSSVHGLVAKLIKIKDVSTATALEVAAGGKLYNVVVDTEVTGKKLLQNGQLKRRYTIIPLNKISANPIQHDVIQQANNLVGKNNAQTALSLIGYESELRAAMEFVFGNAFICKDMNTAKKVTFDSRIMKKSVTLDGDSFDPAGTLTGGARARTGSVLAKLSELTEAEELLSVKEKHLQEVDRELHKIKQEAQRWRELKQQVDLKQRELELLEEKLKHSVHHKQLEEIQALEQTIAEQEKLLGELEERKKYATALAKELEYKIKNAKALHDQELKQAEKEMNNCKKQMEDSKKKMNEMKQEVESMRLEAEGLEADIATCSEQISAVDEAINAFRVQVEELTEIAAQATNDVQKAQVALTEQKALLKERNKDINEKLAEQKRLQKEMNDAQLELKEMEHKITKCNKECHDAAQQVEHMLVKYDWISDERKYFGQANTAYDFKATDPKDAGKRIQKLQEIKEKLAKNVNMRAMNMLGKAEEQYNDLVKKRGIVLNDKAKIAAAIVELDEKKNEALQKAYQQVNKDFGSIYSTLLPGTQAKLVPPEGETILAGLEVKVAFGGVWKESLSELSGGQRSLIALSLILSLLLFKPAPLYILDEVDAALDLSHTQNIGQMLRTHFRHSQFIVVSLKDGMFNNANVLFRTKFVDGVSMVTRYVQNQQEGQAALTFSNNSDAAHKKKAKTQTNTKRARVENMGNE